jgi:CubicO group peptidase (beta-lactamase class C family)
MARNHTAGLLVIRDGRVVCERYGLGLQPHERWSTMSTIKSVTALLVGIAVREGAIASLDDPVVRYLPSLAGSAYDAVSVRHLLTMSSGVAWTEVYDDPESDVNRYSRSMAEQVPGGVLALMRGRVAQDPPGSRFAYNSGDTYLLGALVSAATGRRLADYLSERIWQPFGMEFDAFYTLESAGGQEIGGSRAGMTLRDLGRLALYVLADGVVDGRATLPEGWVADCGRAAFVIDDPLRAPDGIVGYGYCWWITDDGAMNAFGHAGQRIWIDRARRLAVVILSAVPQPPYRTAAYADSAVETRSLLKAIRDAG